MRYSIASVARLYEALYQHILAEGTLQEFAAPNLAETLNEAEMQSIASCFSDFALGSHAMPVEQFAGSALKAGPRR